MANEQHNQGIHGAETPDVSHIQNPDVTHETSDVNVRAILMFVGGLMVFGAIVHLLMWAMFDTLDTRARATQPPPAPLAMSEAERLPPDPRLQLAPGFGVDLPNGKRADLSTQGPQLPVPRGPQSEYKLVRGQWDEVLEAGAKDQSGKTVGVPIEQAMRNVVQQGLPSRQQQGGAKAIDYGIDMPTSQSSGRKSEKRDQ